jgi:uncharacterized damage-inducible protein DinB
MKLPEPNLWFTSLHFNQNKEKNHRDSIMPTIIDVLLKVFEHEAKQANAVLTACKDVKMDYIPKEGMRTLGELANHLAQIPLLDPPLFTGELATAEQTQAREKELYRDSLKGLLTVFDEGIQAVTKLFTGMTEKDFFAETLQPFYEQESKKNWAYYLPEIITHIVMHKMQLWMYLKLAGTKVNMMTYYGHHPE